MTKVLTDEVANLIEDFFTDEMKRDEQPTKADLDYLQQLVHDEYYSVTVVKVENIAITNPYLEGNTLH